MIKYSYTNAYDVDDDNFENNLIKLFNEKFEVFLNCGKQCQHIIDLWKLSLDDRILNIIKILGVKNPIISTRPVLFSNSKYISKSEINHTVPPHQDWASMQCSINSIICWVPLININQELGAIKMVPKSHKLGLLSMNKTEKFGLVDCFKDDEFISFNVEQGDIVLFSAFLVHKSGNNITKNIRWSTHFRFNDLNEKTFIERGYPHAYIYKPIDKMLTNNFDTKKECAYYFEKV